jgi:putative restriction endonuclease
MERRRFTREFKLEAVRLVKERGVSVAQASGLPEPLLLDAAHIVADKDERLGQPVIPNGIPLSKIHHAAFDAHLIGIDPTYKLHVSERLLGRNDGPMLDALKRLHGGTIHLPNRMKDRPDQDRLALRFERFKSAG